MRGPGAAPKSFYGQAGERLRFALAGESPEGPTLFVLLTALQLAQRPKILDRATVDRQWREALLQSGPVQIGRQTLSLSPIGKRALGHQLVD